MRSNGAVLMSSLSTSLQHVHVDLLHVHAFSKPACAANTCCHTSATYSKSAQKERVFCKHGAWAPDMPQNLVPHNVLLAQEWVSRGGCRRACSFWHTVPRWYGVPDQRSLHDSIPCLDCVDSHEM